MVAVGVISGNGVSAYPPSTICSSILIDARKAIIYTLQFGEQIRHNVYRLVFHELILEVRLYPVSGIPSTAIIGLEILTIILGVLAAIALIRHEEFEVL